MRYLLPLAAALALAACAPMPAVVAPAPASVTVEAAITKLEAWLRKGTSDEWTLLGTLPAAQRTVVVNNLKLSTGYELRLKAFKADPNADGGDVQMSNDEASSESFDTNADSGGGFAERRNISLTLQLSDQVFSGQATGNVTVQDGELSSTDRPEALGKYAPPKM